MTILSMLIRRLRKPVLVTIDVFGPGNDRAVRIEAPWVRG